MAWAGKSFEDLEEKDDLQNYLMNKLDGVGPIDNLTPDMWGEVNFLSKCQLPSSYGLGIKVG